MPLTASCHSLRPDKSTGWLAYFELAAKGSRAGSFLVVGPVVVERSEDVQAALRAGQAAVRYLKEVPSHAPPVTLLEATARILAHESGKTGTPLEFGCAVLDSDELWLLTRGAVRLVPLGGSTETSLGAEKPLGVSASAGDRFFLGRLPRGSTDEKVTRDFQARLEHGGGGDGGLVLQLVQADTLSTVEGTADLGAVGGDAQFDTVLKELQHSLEFEPREDPEGVETVEEPHLHRSRKPSLPPSPEREPAPSRPEPEPNLELDLEPDPGERRSDATPVSPGGDRPEDGPSPPPPLREAAPPGAREPFAPEETRGLGFWLGVVTAVAVLGILIAYVTVLRPGVRGGGASEEAVVADAAPGAELLPPDNLADARVWEDRFTEAVTSSPLVVGDKVVFGCRDGRVYALNRTDGRRIWAYAASEGFGSSPALCGSMVVIGGYDGNVYALDVTTGEERWVVETRGRIVSSPAVNENTAFVGSYDHSLYAISVLDGRVLWSRDLGSVLWASPVLEQGLLVAAGLNGEVFRVDPGTGKVFWLTNTGAPVYSSPAIGGGRVFVGSKGGFLLALDGETGKEVWRVRGDGEVNGSPGYREGTVVVGTDAGAILGVDAETGEKLWSVATGGEVKSRPAFVGRMAWVPGYDGFFHGIDWRSGEEIASIRTDSSAFSSPAVQDGIAYFGAMDGRFFALRVVGSSS